MIEHHQVTVAGARGRICGRAAARTAVLAVLCVMLAGPISGCAALVVGAIGGTAGAIYVMEKLEDELEAPVPRVHKAVVATLREMDLPLLEDRADSMSAKVESKFADGKHVWISLKSVGDSRTAITIRVGLAGDKLRSQKILEGVRRRV